MQTRILITIEHGPVDASNAEKVKLEAVSIERTLRAFIHEQAFDTRLSTFETVQKVEVWRTSFGFLPEIDQIKPK